MTRTELAEFKILRIKHLKHGIGAIADIERYLYLLSAVRGFISALPTTERYVMELLYIHGHNPVYVGIVLHYSDSQVRRIRRRALDRLE